MGTRLNGWRRLWVLVRGDPLVLMGSQLLREHRGLAAR